MSVKVRIYWHIGRNNFLFQSRTAVTDKCLIDEIISNFQYTASSVTGANIVYLHKKRPHSVDIKSDDVIDLYGREGLRDPFSIIKKYIEATHKETDNVIVVFGERPMIPVR